MAVGDRVDQFRALARSALSDLFDQSQPFGRLALVQVLMLAGDTLVTISLAYSVFFSISPHEAKNKVLLYLLLTLAPFAVVSPLLGPLIDRSKGARRATAVASAVGRAVICPFMAADVHSLLLFPEAFLILVLSKLYLVTRGALVPEMMSLTGSSPSTAASSSGAVLPEHQVPEPGVRVPPPAAVNPQGGPSNPGYAGLNARLTLLGTLAGFVAAIPGAAIVKLAGSPGVLVFDTFVFVAAAVAAVRLPAVKPQRPAGGRAPARPRHAATPVEEAVDPDLASLQPVAEPQVLLGLTANSVLRGIAGFFVFMLAFGLRRYNHGHSASLFWYGFALAGSGVGSLLGLVAVPRLRRRFAERQILLTALCLVAVFGVATALLGDLPAQGLLALGIGVAGSLGQPSFDAITQRIVPEEQQGRVFAKFATRQQLVWVIGALVPVVITMPLQAGDVVIAVVGAIGAIFYFTSRRTLQDRALPRQFRRRGSGAL
ncbi:MAG: MFS transporter [Acidimicrobiales bacterium]